jgi:hypothetical protein
MLTLKSQNQSLTKNTSFSFLSTNYASGVGSVVVSNSNVFAANDHVLFGEWGSESSELMLIDSVNTSTHTITFKADTTCTPNLPATTKFSHSESTRITIVKYNSVKFYRTTTDTFSIASPLTANYVSIQADQYTTNYHDTTNSTGYGWFVYYGSYATPVTNSSPSNAIPYADFGENSVKKIFDQFYSLLNTKEVSLISSAELFGWMNEGYSRILSELNLANQEFGVPAEYALSVTSGTAEYDLVSLLSTASLPSFDELQSITDADGYELEKINFKDKRYADTNYSSSTLKYYLRGSYIGFSPKPTESETIYLYYTGMPAKLTSLYDNIVLPRADHYILVNFLLFRAGMKLKRSQADISIYKTEFDNGIKSSKLGAVNRSASRDKFELDRYSNV